MTEKSNGNGAKGGISKKEAVRQALSALGMDAPRVEVQNFIKDHFKLDISPNHISSCKSDIQLEKKPKKAAQPKAAESKAPSAKKDQSSHSAAAIGIRLEDIESVKKLVERVGADSLKKLIGMLTH